MTLAASGAISLGGSVTDRSVNVELGKSATAQISLNDADVRTLTGTSSGTQISLPSNFWGKSNDVISISDQTFSDYTFCSAAQAYYTLKSNGVAYKGEGPTETSLGNWVTPTGSASNYEVYATLSSGSLTTGTTGSWLALSSNRLWSVEASGNNGQSAVIVVEIRRIGTTTVLDSATISMEAVDVCI